MAGIRRIISYTTNEIQKFHLFLDLIKGHALSTYLKISISLFKTLKVLSVPHLRIITNIEWLSVFKIFYYNQLTFFSARWRLYAGRIGWLTIVELVKLKRTWKRQLSTGWWILNVGSISKPLENVNIKFIHDITV